MRDSATLGTLTIFLLLFTFCSIPSVHATASWSIQTVDENAAGQGNGYCPVVLASLNLPHILSTGQNSSVMYARFDGSGWSSQKIAVGMAFDLAIDGNDNPHILIDSRGLTYSSWTGTKWINQTVDKNGAGYGALKLDADGNPHIAYITGNTVKYASWTGKDWNIQTVDMGDDIPYRLSFALGTDNMPYLLYSPSEYTDNTQAIDIRAINLRIANLNSSAWRIESVLPQHALGGFGSLALDSRGYPCLVFTQHHFLSTSNMATISTVLYARWDGIKWHIQTVVSDVKLDYGSMRNEGSLTLSLDKQDNPHISYVTLDKTLTYARWTGINWKTQTMDRNVSVKGPCYLALDSNDNPHITFRTLNSLSFIDNMKYAALTGDFPQEPSPAPSNTETYLTSVVLAIISLVILLAYVWLRKKSNIV